MFALRNDELSFEQVLKNAWRGFSLNFPIFLILLITSVIVSASHHIPFLANSRWLLLLLNLLLCAFLLPMVIQLSLSSVRGERLELPLLFWKFRLLTTWRLMLCYATICILFIGLFLIGAGIVLAIDYIFFERIAWIYGLAIGWLLACFISMKVALALFVIVDRDESVICALRVSHRRVTFRIAILLAIFGVLPVGVALGLASILIQGNVSDPLRLFASLLISLITSLAGAFGTVAGAEIYRVTQNVT